MSWKWTLARLCRSIPTGRATPYCGRIWEHRRVLTQPAPSRLADCGPAARVLGSNFFFHGRNAIFTRHGESNGLATSSQIRSSPIVAADLAREPVPRTRAKRRHRAPAVFTKETVQACLQERDP